MIEVAEWVDVDSDWQIDVDLVTELEASLRRLIDVLEVLKNDGKPHDRRSRDDLDRLSGYPYCGCTLCVTRETLVFVLPVIAQGYADGRIQPTVTDDEMEGV